MATLQFTQGQPTRPAGSHHADQLLPNLVDGMARVRPNALYAVIPRSFTSYADGYRKVTYAHLANAVDGVAWLLATELGPPEQRAEALAYVGPNDISYVVMVLAAVKAGYSILSLAPRNTPSDHASLFAATGCRTLLTLAPPYTATVEAIFAGLSEDGDDDNKPPRTIHVPTIYELLDTEHADFPYAATFADVKHEALLTVHTSGSTSAPKPVTYTHALVESHTLWMQEPPPDGYVNQVALLESDRVFTGLPFFHAGCLFLSLFDAIPNQTTIVQPLAGVPPSAQVIVDGLAAVPDADVVHLPAPFMEQICQNPRHVELVASRVHTVAFGGGDISTAAGDAMAATGVTVVNFNGSTETTAYPTMRPRRGFDPADWKYIQPHPVAGMEFRSAAEHGNLAEAVLVRNTRSENLQPVFVLFPELSEWPTRDLWSEHPRKKGLWLYRGRADDIIISATGELCNPVAMEQAVGRHGDVAAALMVGTGRYQKALLVEPKDEALAASEEKRREFVDRIWDVVEAANQNLPVVARIAKTHTMLTDTGAPLPRAGKGTVQRAPSLKLYADRIDRLYHSAGDGTDGNLEPYQVHISVNGGSK